MLPLIVGVAIGVVVMGLLRAMTRYEAASTAAMQEQMTSMQATIDRLEARVRSLETIASVDVLETGSEQPMPGETAQPLKKARLGRT
ncbi:MAG: hypothetical protein JJ896_17995 [Rhodothermales bacterium]|nr:hypothetical protein [Rhodothermales bacterium]MBO6781556.1 hypothetical protein [Rhodothermales bacterium]